MFETTLQVEHTIKLYKEYENDGAKVHLSRKYFIK